MKETYNKKEAAEFLGRQVRMVATYAQEGRLPRELVKIKGVEHAMFKHSDLVKLKAELDAAARPATVVKGATATPAISDTPATSTAIATVQPEFIAGVQGMELFASLVAKEISKTLKEDRKEARQDAIARPSELASKMVLTVPEASVLSGFSEYAIREDIKASKLKAVRKGRSIQVRTSDLQNWVDAQF